MSVYDLMASELREQRALAIQVIERQNELAESLSQQLQDARAWARLWKRAAKHQFMLCGVLERAYKSSDAYVGELVVKGQRKDAEIERYREALGDIEQLSESVNSGIMHDGSAWYRSLGIARAALKGTDDD